VLSLPLFRVYKLFPSHRMQVSLFDAPRRSCSFDFLFHLFPFTFFTITKTSQYQVPSSIFLCGIPFDTMVSKDLSKMFTPVPPHCQFLQSPSVSAFLSRRRRFQAALASPIFQRSTLSCYLFPSPYTTPTHPLSPTPTSQAVERGSLVCSPLPRLTFRPVKKSLRPSIENSATMPLQQNQGKCPLSSNPSSRDTCRALAEPPPTHATPPNAFPSPSLSRSFFLYTFYALPLDCPHLY